MEKEIEKDTISHQGKTDTPEEHKQARRIDLTEEKTTCSSGTNVTKAKQKPPEEKEDDKLSLISWNLDGLDLECIVERSKGFLSYLTEYSPDVVFLQELIPPYAKFLKKKAVDYLLILGGEEAYFTGMMLKKSSVNLLDSNIVPYPNTKQLRNLLVAQVKFKGLHLCLMTSHFESCKPNAEERMNQLRLVLQRMTEAPDDVTVLFGGDTNLRDKEMAVVGLPPGVCDIWEKLGSREHCRYTWDTKANDNKDADYISLLRFDRVYLRPATGAGVPRPAPFNMALIGRERLDCDRFTSDHWGIYAQFTTR